MEEYSLWSDLCGFVFGCSFWNAAFINVAQDILELGVFLVVTVLVCIKYKHNKS